MKKRSKELYRLPQNVLKQHVKLLLGEKNIPVKTYHSPSPTKKSQRNENERKWDVKALPAG